MKLTWKMSGQLRDSPALETSDTILVTQSTSTRVRDYTTIHPRVHSSSLYDNQELIATNGSGTSILTV